MVQEQVVLNFKHLDDVRDLTNNSELLVLAFASAVSLLVLVATGAKRCTRASSSPRPSGSSNLATTTLIYDIIRVLACVTLAISTAVVAVSPTPNQNHTSGQAHWATLIIPSVASYATFLSILHLFPTTTDRLNTKFHATALLLVVSTVYIYRDVWTFATYRYHPKDPRGPLLWTHIISAMVGGVVLPLLEPSQLPTLTEEVPVIESKQDSSPEQASSWLSWITFFYIDPFINRANRLPRIGPEDFVALPNTETVLRLVQSSFPVIDRFSGAPNRHIGVSLLILFRKEFVICAVLTLVKVASNFTVPFAINRILNHLESHGEGAVFRSWVWVALLLIGPCIGTLAFQVYAYINVVSAVRAEAFLTRLIFDHALRMRAKADTGPEKDDLDGKKATQSNFAGKLNNLITLDMWNIADGREFLVLILWTPLELGLAMYFLYFLLGWATFVGIGVMVVCLPLPGYFGNRMQVIQRQCAQKTDSRVQSVVETLSVLRMVKMFGWEDKMSSRIFERRDEELVLLLKRKLFELAWGELNWIIPLVQMIATFATFTVVMEQPLSASLVFSTMPVFVVIRSSLFRQLQLFNQMIRAKVSLDRLNDVLTESELLDVFTEKTLNTMPEIGEDISIQNATFAWSTSEVAPSAAARSFRLCVEGSLSFRRGRINLVVGPTGSGKTSLLMAFLGEMHVVGESTTSRISLPRSLGVAYAAQESWVQNATIRDNILFGTPFDRQRYDKVVMQCALSRDFDLFDAGDLTEVGEKGITLSGGQKARVTLARAVYSSAEVLLLDDVLAALDVHTSKWIVQQCLQGDLMRGRTVILVTHNVALTGPVADFVVEMVDGKITKQGSASNVLSGYEISQEQVDEEEGLMEAEEETDSSCSAEAPKVLALQANGQLIKKEETAEGRVSTKALRSYTSSMAGSWGWSFWLLVMANMAMAQGLNPFLGQWAKQYSIGHPSEVNVAFYLTGYSAILVLNMIVYTIWIVAFMLGQMRASKKVHTDLIATVLGSTLRWLDTTPVSRIIVRATSDVGTVDARIPGQLQALLDHVMVICTRLGAVVLFSPILLLPGVVLAWVGTIVAQRYLKAQLVVKRQLSVLQAPVLAHFSAAVSGIVSVRAFGKADAFREELNKRSQHYMRANRLRFGMNCWITVRMEVLANMFPTIVAAYLVYGRNDLDVSNVGFSIGMATAFGGAILYTVRAWNELEVDSNSLERLLDYSSIEQEPKATKVGTPPAYWPASGDLRVEHLSASYSMDGPNILHDISFTIKGGERIGVVGRTASGKSSLTLALLRCIYTSGSVFFDGLDTAKLNLENLRTAITIIPQMPELLSGTLRQNLDPFGQHDDATLNEALRAAGLFSLQSSETEGSEDMVARLNLDSNIASGGGNVSVGQRQVLSLARALVRQSKLLILDEATSAIDHATDTVIQASLRGKLPKDTSVLIVAHRLQTIMDADKIMVLDAGRIVEFGAPQMLLQNEGGLLRALVDESADRERLHAMAISPKVGV